MASELTYGIKLTADGKSLTDAVKQSQDAIDKLGQSTRTAAADTGKFSAAQQALTSIVKLAAAAFSVHQVAEYGVELAKLAARHETLGVAMNAVGKNAGYNAGEMNAYAAGVQKMGITMNESRESVMRMTQAGIDLSKSQQLARIAQDAAVIGNVNSSEALATLIHGIQSAQTDVLRTIGITVDFEASYKRLALQLRKTTDDLSESEKMTARTNAVMESGTGIAGTYEAAMGTAGKQMSSLARYSEDAKVKMGAVFSDTLLLAVGAYTEHLKEANAGMVELAANKKLDQWSEEVAINLAFVADSIKYSFGSVVTVLDTAYTGLDQFLHLLAANPSGAADAGSAYAKRLESRFGADSSLQVLRKELSAKRDLDARTVWEPGSKGLKPAYQWSDPSGKAAFEDQEAFIKGAQNAIAKARSEAETEWGKYLTATRSKQELMTQEIKRAQAAAATLGGATAAQLPKVLAAIRDKYDSGYNDALLTQTRAAQEALYKLNEEDAKRNLKLLDLRHSAGLMSEEGYLTARIELEKAAAGKELAAVLEEYRAIDAARRKEQDPAKRAGLVAQQLKLAPKISESGQAYDHAGEETGQKLFNLDVAAFDEANKIIEQASAASREHADQLAFEASLIGKTALQTQILTAQRKIDIEEQKKELAVSQDPKFRGREVEAQRAKDALREIAAADKELAAAEIANSHSVATAWDTGATAAMNSYLDTVSNSAAQSNKLFTDAFKGMEDALVKFVKTGKLDFHSLADTIISDLIRIQVQNSITKPLAQAMGSGGASGIFSGAGDFFSSLFSANGNAFGADGVHAFANGGAFTNSIVSGPTPFAFANGGSFGLGVMGEAGDEAVMPLTRINGKLGVQATGGGGGSVTVTQPVIIIAPNATAGTVEQIRALMPGLLAENKRVIEGVIVGAMRRQGGRLAV